MRLIDADKLMENIEVRMKSNENDLNAVHELRAMNRYIAQLSPDYDIDKVVEQLMIAKGNGCPPGYKCKDDESCEECMIRYAIDIVKSVAIDN